MKSRASLFLTVLLLALSLTACGKEPAKNDRNDAGSGQNSAYDAVSDPNRDNVPNDEASELRKRCGTTVVGDATSGLTPLLHQFTLNSTWLLRSAPSLTGCFL